MNEKRSQWLIEKIQASTETLFHLLETDPNNAGIVQTKGRIQDLMWNLRAASGLGNDSCFLQDLKNILDDKDIQKDLDDSEKKALTKVVSILGRRKVKFK